ncbi:MAG TPA: AmmeMemoRadiSam system protein B [Pirellulales bacterium]|nr:AmmeMemoRadiSam system protein B [Pirellulales bacterium]
MTQDLRPRLRDVECFPVNQTNGEVQFALRDPNGFAPSVVVPYHAAVLASLMNGARTLAEIQQQFQKQFGQGVALEDLEGLIAQLDERWFLDNERFRRRWKAEVEQYLNSKVRPAAHAGGAYAAEPEPLLKQLDALFLPPAGPGLPASLDRPGATPAPASANGDGQLMGVLSPHIDLRRGGPAFAWAYQRLVDESDANLFVIFGTAHSPMRYLFSTLRKHFDTPLGTVETDLSFINRLASNLKKQPGGAEVDLFAGDLAHRHEHSIEFQVLFLQYLLGGRRPFKIVPVLTGSFHSFIAEGRQPRSDATVSAFSAAMRQTAAEYTAGQIVPLRAGALQVGANPAGTATAEPAPVGGRVSYISGGDLAHIGQRFGDRQLLDKERLELQTASDLRVLSAACQADAGAMFDEIAREQDANRICGLSPTYTMLEVMQPRRGELLKYGQAVEPDGTSCVSFGSAAFYGG